MCSYQKYLSFFFQAVTKRHGKPEKKNKRKKHIFFTPAPVFFAVNPATNFNHAQTVTISDADRGTSSGGNITDKSLTAESTKRKSNRRYRDKRFQDEHAENTEWETKTKGAGISRETLILLVKMREVYGP